MDHIAARFIIIPGSKRTLRGIMMGIGITMAGTQWALSPPDLKIGCAMLLVVSGLSPLFWLELALRLGRPVGDQFGEVNLDQSASHDDGQSILATRNGVLEGSFVP